MDKEKQAFLKEVKYVANGLNIQVLAEGIERQEELEYCRDLKMDFAQGYLIGKPNTGEFYSKRSF